MTELEFDPTKISPGVQKITDLQHALVGTGNTIQLGADYYDRQRTKEAMKSLEPAQTRETSKSLQRTREQWSGQSREPLRPFVELIANACDSISRQQQIDYGFAPPTVAVQVSARSDGGYTIIISDKGSVAKQHGEGMAVEYFSKLMKPFATGNEGNSETVGMMGVGAQQRLSLLRNPDDRIFISSSTSQGILVSKEQLASDGENIDLRHGGAPQKENERRGTSFVIQLSAMTAGEIGLTTPTLCNYLKDKFGGSFDKAITLTSVDQGVEHAEKKVESITPVKNQFEQVALTSDKTIQLAFSKERTTVEEPKCRVFLDVLGISYGEPLEINRSGLPRVIRLNMNQKIATITEGRGKFGLNRPIVQSIMQAVDNYWRIYQIDSRTKAQLFDALYPMFSRFADLRSLPVALRTDPSLNLTKAIERTYSKVLADDSVGRIIPLELMDVFGTIEGTLVVTSEQLPRGYPFEFENLPNVSVVDELTVNDKPIIMVDLPDKAPFRIVAEHLFVSRNYFSGLLSQDRVEKQGCMTKLAAVVANMNDATPNTNLRIRYNKEIALVTGVQKQVGVQIEAVPTTIDNPDRELVYSRNQELSAEIKQRDIMLYSRNELLAFVRKAFDISNYDNIYFLEPNKDFMGKPLRKDQLSVLDVPDYVLRVVVALISGRGFSHHFTSVLSSIDPSFLNPTTSLNTLEAVQKNPYSIHWFALTTPLSQPFLKSVGEGRCRGYDEYVAQHLGENWATQYPQLNQLLTYSRDIGVGQLVADVLIKNVPLLSKWQVFSHDIDEATGNLLIKTEAQAKKVLYDLPALMQTLGVQVNHENLVLLGLYKHGSEKERTSKLPEDTTKAFDRIIAWLKDDTELAVQPQEDPSKSELGDEINPASLWILHQTNKLDATQSIAEQTNFEPDREALRALLHPINRLHSDPGTSFSEVVKNALDALSRDTTADRQVRVSDSQVFDHQSKEWEYCVEVQDKVGMDPQQAIVKLTLPQIGEGIHGLGFLKLLAEFDEIRVITSNGISTVELVYKPIRSDDGQDAVIDFRVHYQELAVIRRGTKVKLIKKSDSPSVDAAIFRGSLIDFARQIPDSAGQIYLNDQEEPLNTELQTVASFTDEDLGRIEFTIRKDRILSHHPNPKVTVQRVEVGDFNVGAIIQTRLRSLPPAFTEILASSDFSINFDGIKTTTIRDGSGFANEQQVISRICRVLNDKIEAIIASLARGGTLNCQNFLTTHFSPRLYDSPGEFVGKEAELRLLAGSDENTLRMIDLVYTLPWKGNDGNVYSNLLDWLLAQDKTQRKILQPEQDKLTKVDYWESIPQSVRPSLQYYHSMFAPTELFTFEGGIASSGQTSQIDSLHPKKAPIYQTDKPGSRAFYFPLYGSLHYSSEVLEELQSSDPTIRARGIKTVAHELTHLEEDSEEGLVHPPEFYKNVENKLLAIEDRIYV